jgi:CRP-like cAMP-binding protein
MSGAPRPEQNHILDALPPAERERLFPYLKLVSLPLGKVLYESGDRLQHIYFPTDSIISLLYVLEDGASAEIAVVGNDGAIGVALFMGGETTTNRAIVQSSGFAYKLTGARLKREFNRHGDVLNILLRYTQALITQMAQTAVCNRHHSVDQQLCRWLLLSLDRLSSSQLNMTQELIANMLGVRREGVTEAAGKLQKLGVIAYSRGQIEVLDREALERLCCECYGVVKKETDRLLPLRHSDQTGTTLQECRGTRCERQKMLTLGCSLVNAPPMKGSVDATGDTVHAVSKDYSSTIENTRFATAGLYVQAAIFS